MLGAVGQLPLFSSVASQGTGPLPRDPCSTCAPHAIVIDAMYDAQVEALLRRLACVDIHPLDLLRR